MKLIIAGGRNISITPTEIEMHVVNFKIEPTEIVSGAAQGVDQVGEEFAKLNEIPLRQFYPDWGKHGRAAGPLRNAQMAQYGDALILFWDGKSKGSASMKREMQKLGKKIYEVVLPC